jgi:hypothetical protein
MSITAGREKMKRFICTVLVLFVCAAALASCKREAGAKSTTTTNVTGTTYNGSLVNGLPVYVDGAIPLRADWELELLYKPLLYRNLYYDVSGTFSDLVPNKEYMQWSTELRKTYDQTGPHEMELASFVKHFQIPRATFDKAVQFLINAWTSMGIANTDEMYEIPNADIIYTFDNKIINEYYRRA